MPTGRHLHCLSAPKADFFSSSWLKADHSQARSASIGWHLSCPWESMMRHYVHDRSSGTPLSFRTISLLALLVLAAPVTARAESPSITLLAPPESLAFARYVASIRERDPFTESEPVLVEIEASLPGLYKQSSLLAIRQTGESERSEYQVLQIEGDATVTQEVIARYLILLKDVEG